MTAASGELEGSVHINPDHLPVGRQPHLSLAGEQHVPDLVLLAAD
jgi:hypothetical protein